MNMRLTLTPLKKGCVNQWKIYDDVHENYDDMNYDDNEKYDDFEYEASYTYSSPERLRDSMGNVVAKIMMRRMVLIMMVMIF